MSTIERARLRNERVARALHPAAWWIWALGVAVAASRTTNPILLAMTFAVLGLVVVSRRTDAPWARGFRAYLVIGLVVIGIRVVFRMLLDGQYGEHVLFTLPRIPLPRAAAAIRLGGPVSLEGLLAALYDGLRLATLLACVGAANVLADAKRLLKALPGALHEVGVAVTIALTLAPQLVESAARVRRARKLRAGPTGRRAMLRGVVVPVIEDALDRSMALAEAMDGRGFGRVEATPRRARLITAGLVLGGLSGLCVGVYGLLDGTTSSVFGLPMLIVGSLLCVGGVTLGGRRVRRTVYRPDPWLGPEWLVAGCGIVAAVILFWSSSIDPGNLNPSLQPLTMPRVTWQPLLGLAVAALPAWLAPPVTAGSRHERQPQPHRQPQPQPQRQPQPRQRVVRT